MWSHRSKKQQWENIPGNLVSWDPIFTSNRSCLSIFGLSYINPVLSILLPFTNTCLPCSCSCDDMIRTLTPRKQQFWKLPQSVSSPKTTKKRKVTLTLSRWGFIGVLWIESRWHASTQAVMCLSFTSRTISSKSICFKSTSCSSF